MNIQIWSCRFGRGHLSAAETLKQTIHQIRPEDRVELKDLIELTFPYSHALIYRAYQKLIVTGSKIVNRLYGESPNKAMRPKASALESLLLLNLFEELDESLPDVAIATYSLASKALARYKQRYPEAFLLITCITDIQAHPGWVNHETDLYLVACQATREDLIRQGIDPAKIIVQGIPVPAIEPALPEGRQPNILVSGGGLGLLPQSQAFYRGLDRCGARVTVVCGKNDKLFRKLRQMDLRHVEVVGYCNDMPDRLRQADVLLTKPGGITTFEAISAEVPLMVLFPHLPQEQKNAAFITELALGCLMPKQDDQVPQRLRQIMDQPEQLQHYRRNMRQFRLALQSNGLASYLGSRLC